MVMRGRRPRRGAGDPEDRRQVLRLSELGRLRRLLAFVRPYRKRMALAITAVVIASAMGLVFPLVVGRLVDSALSESAAGDTSTINRIALGLLGVFAIQAVFNYIQQYQLAAVGEGVVADIRTGLYSHLMLLSVKFFEDRKTGEITSAGTLTCTACGQKVHLKSTGVVPPCPSCHATQFRKGY